MTKNKESLREKMAKRVHRVTSDLPILVYGAVILALILVWYFRWLNDDLAMNFFSELLGAAFTLFIIDTLLVRSKSRRWKIVQENVDYLIARSVNRLRDGLATRAFGFAPVISADQVEWKSLESVRQQRADLLNELSVLSSEKLKDRLAMNEVFSDSTYHYINEKADEIWDLLNMKYSEYLAPELVSMLIELHTRLKDAAGHIRQYRKTERFKSDESYYRTIGINGLSNSLLQIIRIVNRLKEEGYSESATIL